MVRDKGATSPKFTQPTVTNSADRAMLNTASMQQKKIVQQRQQKQNLEQTLWLRYRNPRTAVEDMLQPGVLEALGGSLPIDFSPEGPISGASNVAPSSPLLEDKLILPPLGTGGPLKADDVRHELWHYVTQNAGKLPSNIRQTIPAQNRFVESKWGAFLSELLGSRMEISESAAISFGGQSAYPGFTPTFDPWEFINVFNPKGTSFNYPK
jgi:hypothetical protein